MKHTRVKRLRSSALPRFELRGWFCYATRWAAGVVLLALALSAEGARFSVLHSGFDGGGGSIAGGAFTSETSISPFAGGGHIALLNESPSSGKDFFELPAAGAFAVRIADLLANDFDVEGNSPALSLRQTNTTQGGFLSLSDGIIVYTPPVGPDIRGDSFQYVVSDSFGVGTVGTVFLVTAAASPRLMDVRLNGRNVELIFQALANEAYMLQARPALNARIYWQDYPAADQPMVAQADGGGIVRFVIPLGGANQFFRAVDIESLASEVGIARTGGQLNISLRGLPNTVYKLQFRSALEPGQEWHDYPSGARPFSVRSAYDGIYEFAVPMLDAYSFFRTVPREP